MNKLTTPLLGSIGIFCGLLISATSALAAANPDGPYIGLWAGAGDITTSNNNDPAYSQSQNKNWRSSRSGISVGYRFNPWFAVDLTSGGFNAPSESAFVTIVKDITLTSPRITQISGSMIEPGVRMMLPLGDSPYEFSVRAGAAFISTTASYKQPNGQAWGNGKREAERTVRTVQPVVAAGVRGAFNENWGMSVEYSTYLGKGAELPTSPGASTKFKVENRNNVMLSGDYRF